MNCPKDGAPLETHDLLGVQVDECPTCRGFFFEHGELEKAKNAADPDLKWMDVELWKDEDSYNLALSQWACPRDGQPMVAIAYDDSGVVIDHCLKCKGVWLDGGKFAELIAALENELLSKPGDEYFKESLEEAGELVTGDKGFASEWRDFLTVVRLMQYRVLSENPKLAEALAAYARATPFK